MRNPRRLYFIKICNQIFFIIDNFLNLFVRYCSIIQSFPWKFSDFNWDEVSSHFFDDFVKRYEFEWHWNESKVLLKMLYGIIISHFDCEINSRYNRIHVLFQFQKTIPIFFSHLPIQVCLIQNFLIYFSLLKKYHKLSIFPLEIIRKIKFQKK